MKHALLALFFLFACAGLAPAKDAPPLGDPIVEARLKTISEDLRCLVCQNTTLADSHAALAEDLRNEVRILIREGRSDAEIRAYLVERYGDFVLYTPPWKKTTALLWTGPFVLFGGALFAAIVMLRRRQSRAQTRALDEQDQARAEASLADPE
jgi:cytochrome c-type biogenesis protein CcmH